MHIWHAVAWIWKKKHFLMRTKTPLDSVPSFAPLSENCRALKGLAPSFTERQEEGELIWRVKICPLFHCHSWKSKMMRWHFSARLHPHKGSFETLSSLFHLLQWTQFTTSSTYVLQKPLSLCFALFKSEFISITGFIFTASPGKMLETDKLNP